jgi:DnaJ homolog subfamily A member 2
MDPADIFAHFFGETMFTFGPSGGGPGRRRGKGEDSVIPYEVTLEDLYNGKTVKMNMEKEIVCSQCKGYFSLSNHINVIPLMLSLPRSGARGHAKPKPCVTCEGKGWNFVQSQVRICIGCRL